MTPNTILVYAGLELMGDGFIKLPFVRALRAAHPQAHITWLAGKGRSVYAHELAPLVKGVIDTVIEHAGIGSETTELLGPRPLERAFDLVIDTQSRVLTTLIVRRLEHRRFVSPAANFLFSSVRPPRGYQKPGHLHHRLMDLAALAIGGRPAVVPPPPLPAEMTARMARLLPDGPHYIGMAPGAGNRAKCWPLERYVELAQRQIARARTPVFFLGPNETEWYAPLAKALPEARFPIQEAAAHDIAPGLFVTLAAAQRCAIAVVNDSGIAHMLAESGIPLVSLFGPSSSAKFHPMPRQLKLVRAQAFGGDTMDRIPVDAVETALDIALDRPTASDGDDRPAVTSQIYG